MSTHPFRWHFLRHPKENTPSLIGDNHFINAKKNSKKPESAGLVERCPPIAIKMPKASVQLVQLL
jgi:hypothetical protein